MTEASCAPTGISPIPAGRQYLLRSAQQLRLRLAYSKNMQLLDLTNGAWLDA
jgi:hypothetical protein